MILSFEGEAEGVKSDQLIDEVIESVADNVPVIA